MLLSFIRAHWSTVLLVGTAVIAIVFRIFVDLLNIENDISDQVIQYFILTIVSGFIVESAFERQKVSKNLERLSLKKKKSNNSFAKSLIELEEGISNGILAKRISCKNKHESMAILLRLMNSTKTSYKGLNYYTGGWNTAMVDYFCANMDAVRRKVTVTRYFIINSHVQNDLELFKQLTQKMEEHYSEGIIVYFATEKDLQNIPYFQGRPIRGCGMYDNTTFTYDNLPAKQSGCPIEITVTWNTDEINPLNPFPYLEESEYIYRYPEDVDVIKELWPTYERVPL